MIHFASRRSPCAAARLSGSSFADRVEDVTCPVCRGVARAHERGAEDTVRDAAAVTRRMRAVRP